MRYSLSTFAMLSLAVSALAQESKGERSITVIGTATVYAKPDTARIHFGLRATEPTADAVKEVLTKNTKAIEDAVKKIKIGNVVLTTGPIGLKQGSNQNANLAVPIAPGGAAPANPGLGPYTGHTSQTATITNSDSEKLRAEIDSFLKAIVDAGANTNGGDPKDENINFFPQQQGSSGPKVVLSRSDESAARDEAYQKAVANAVKNAKAIAKGLGAADVKVMSVTDEPEKAAAEPFNIYGLDNGNGPRSPAGEIEVKVRVVVKCSY